MCLLCEKLLTSPDCGASGHPARVAPGRASLSQLVLARLLAAPGSRPVLRRDKPRPSWRQQWWPSAIRKSRRVSLRATRSVHARLGSPRSSVVRTVIRLCSASASYCSSSPVRCFWPGSRMAERISFGIAALGVPVLAYFAINSGIALALRAFFLSYGPETFLRPVPFSGCSGGCLAFSGAWPPVDSGFVGGDLLRAQCHSSQAAQVHSSCDARLAGGPGRGMRGFADADRRLYRAGRRRKGRGRRSRFAIYTSSSFADLAILFSALVARSGCAGGIRDRAEARAACGLRRTGGASGDVARSRRRPCRPSAIGRP